MVITLLILLIFQFCAVITLPYLDHITFCCVKKNLKPNAQQLTQKVALRQLYSVLFFVNGFRGHFNRLIQSYLNKRQKYVYSLLRPLLFLIFVKDLPTNMKKSEITLFAEDTNIVCKREDVEFNIKISITEAISWFNEKKTLRFF